MLGGAAIGSYFFLKSNQVSVVPKENPGAFSNTKDVFIAPTDEPIETLAPPENTTGLVEGTISFPSEGIPANLEVCAETIAGVKTTCTNAKIKDAKYKTGVGYKLELSAGTYYIYASTPNFPNKAYYNEFMTCGLMASCPSHKKIEVSVIAGTTTSDIDPGDWYNN